VQKKKERETKSFFVSDFGDDFAAAVWPTITIAAHCHTMNHESEIKATRSPFS
jgi:hypothetical protein